METKPWYQSKTIWGTVTMLLVAVLSIFQVQINDLTPDIQQGLEGAGLLIGAGVTIWGRLSARKSIVVGSGGGVSSILLFWLIASALVFGGCTPQSWTVSDTGTVATTETTTVNGWEKFLTSLKAAAHTGLTAMQTAAKALYTLTANLTPAELDTYLTTFGVDAKTRADVIAGYSQAGASALAAYQIATTIDGATVATQASK